MKERSVSAESVFCKFEMRSCSKILELSKNWALWNLKKRFRPSTNYKEQRLKLWICISNHISVFKLHILLKIILNIMLHASWQTILRSQNSLNYFTI